MMDEEREKEKKELQEYAEKNNLCPVCLWAKHEGERKLLLVDGFFCDGTKRVYDPDEWHKLMAPRGVR